jgi:FG-GAP repeat
MGLVKGKKSSVSKKLAQFVNGPCENQSNETSALITNTHKPQHLQLNINNPRPHNFKLPSALSYELDICDKNKGGIGSSKPLKAEGTFPSERHELPQETPQFCDANATESITQNDQHISLLPFSSNTDTRNFQNVEEMPDLIPKSFGEDNESVASPEITVMQAAGCDPSEGKILLKVPIIKETRSSPLLRLPKPEHSSPTHTQEITHRIECETNHKASSANENETIIINECIELQEFVVKTKSGIDNPPHHFLRKNTVDSTSYQIGRSDEFSSSAFQDIENLIKKNDQKFNHSIISNEEAQSRTVGEVTDDKIADHISLGKTLSHIQSQISPNSSISANSIIQSKEKNLQSQQSVDFRLRHANDSGSVGLKDTTPDHIPLERSQTSYLSLGSYGTTINEEEDFSSANVLRRSSLSTISSHEGMFRNQTKENDIASYHDLDVNVSELGSTSINQSKYNEIPSGGILGLIQSGLEQVFQREEDTDSDDDTFQAYREWLLRSKKPERLGDVRGRIWTKPDSESTERPNASVPPNDDCVEFRFGIARNQRLNEICNVDCDASMENICHSPSLGEKNEDNTSPNSFSLLPESTISMLESLTLPSPMFHEETTIFEKSLQMDVQLQDGNNSWSGDVAFLREVGLTEQMIQDIFCVQDESSRRIIFKDAIAQALTELDIEEFEYDDSDHERNNEDGSNGLKDKGIFATGLPFVAASSLAAFLRKKAKVNDYQKEEDQISFISISSSEVSEEFVVEDMKEVAIQMEEHILSKEENVQKEISEEEKSLGSLGEHSTLFNILEENYMHFENYAGDSFTKRVAFLNEKSKRMTRKFKLKQKKRAIISKLHQFFRRNTEFHDESNTDFMKLLGDEKDIEMQSDLSSMNEDKEIEILGEEKKHAERWDNVDKSDFFHAHQVDWEPEIEDNESTHAYVEDFEDIEDKNSRNKILSLMKKQKTVLKKWPFTIGIGCVIVCVIAIVIILLPRSKLQLDIAAEKSSSVVPTVSPTDFSYKTWDRIGTPMIAANKQAQNGFSLSISDDGHIMAVGMRKEKCFEYPNCGKVHVYEMESVNETSQWTLQYTLNGVNKGNQFGFSVSMAGNGKRLAVSSLGDDGNGENSGMVQVFEKRQSVWDIIEEFRGSHAGEYFGVSISISKDGQMLAVGAPFSNANNLEKSGRVYFFDKIGLNQTSERNQFTSMISGSSAGDYFGWSVSLSADGSRAIIGAPLDPNRGVGGYTKVFDFLRYDNIWVQIGSDLRERLLRSNRFGYSVSMSYTGSRIVIGSHESFIEDIPTGKVFTYQLTNDTWRSLGKPLIADESGDFFGYSVALSPDGDYLVVGAPYHSTGGIARVFKHYEKEGWISSNNIVEQNVSTLGFSVDISYSGRYVAVGIPLNSQASVFS